jgi:2-polyprenyl-3-methyl-5-hydroxy-6-metoxy-1,4-benzoquinol methylase
LQEHDNDGKSVESGEIEFFDRLYHDQAYHPVGWKLRLSRELESLRRVAGGRSLGRVLSLGCGDGQFELMLAPHAEHVTALDISQQAIQIATDNAAAAGVTNVDYRCMALSELSWDDQFDTVLCLAFLHHVPEEDLADLLKRSFDHLTPGGLFYTQEPSKSGVLRAVGRVVLGKRYDTYHSADERELVPAEIAAALRAAGFKRVKIGYIDLTLIPAYYVLTRGPGIPFYACLGVDWAWCHSPFAKWASGFYAHARKPAGPG